MPDSRVHELRKNTTDAEALLWRHLRNRQLSGSKFRRQHPIGPYCVDFACPEKKLIIEVDGGQHIEDAEADRIRSGHLSDKGYRVLRFWNHEVLSDVESVLDAIITALSGEEAPSP